MEIKNDFPFEKHYLAYKGSIYSIYVFDRREDKLEKNLSRSIEIYRETHSSLRSRKTKREKVGREIRIEKHGLVLRIKTQFYYNLYPHDNIDIMIHSDDIRYELESIIKNAVDFIIKSVIDERRSRYENRS